MVKIIVKPQERIYPQSWQWVANTNDDGFIIGTWGGTIIKTDSELNYEE